MTTKKNILIIGSLVLVVVAALVFAVPAMAADVSQKYIG